MTMTEAADAYLASLRARSRHTQRTYATALALFAEYLPSQGITTRNSDITQLPRTVLEDFYLWLVDSQRAPATIKTYTYATRAFVRWCHSHEHLDPAWNYERAIDNLSAVVQPEGNRVPRVNGEAGEIAAVIRDGKLHISTRKTAAVRFRITRDRAIVMLLYDTGVRRDELVNIDLDDFQARRQLVVRGKGDKERVVFYSDAGGYLDQYKTWRTRYGVKGSAFFASSKSGKRIGPDIVTAAVDQYAELAGITFHPHGFRHAFALRMRRNGMDVATLAELLGHSSLDTTVKLYARFTVEDLQKEYEAANA